jgi:hypothetical protein
MRSWVLATVLLAGCDDPVDGPIGGLILTVDPTPWQDDRGGPNRRVADGDAEWSGVVRLLDASRL